MGSGRPSKYNDSTLEVTQNYLDNYAEYGDMIPSIAGLADELSVHRDTIYHWAKDPAKQLFSNMLGQILARQERVLLNKGLTGDYNSRIVKLALAKHGYADKQETQVAGKFNMTDLTEQELDRRMQELEDAIERSTKD